MRVVVIGTGFGARVVAPVFDATPGCEVVDVVSARDEDGVRRAVARPGVDLVSVHSPPFLHAPHVRAALDAGKAVLCDKPFALDGDEAAALEADARDAGVVALCNFEFRYQPARQLLRELLRDGTLGRVEHVQWVHLSAGTRVPLRRHGWLFDRHAGGGFIGAWGSHAVDTLRFVLDAEVVATQGLPRIDVRERPDADGGRRECTAEDGLSASIAMSSGATVAVDGSYAATATLPSRLTVCGAHAVCETVADERVTVRRSDGTRAEVAPGRVETEGVDRHDAAMRRWAEVVRDAVTTGEVPPDAPTFADGRACDEVLERLRAAPFAHELGS